MAVPYTFGTATSSIPLSQLDSNFATVITLGNTAIQLGNTVTTLNNMTLANVTISSGNITLTNVSATTANVTTANITTAVIGTETVTTSTITSANITTANVTTANITTGNVTTGTVSTSLTLSYGTANAVAYLNGSKVVTTGSALTFDGTNFATTGTATAAKLIPTGSSATGNGLYLPAANALGLSTNGTNAVYIDASQNVGIGTSSPSQKLDVVNTANSGISIRVNSTNAGSSTYGALIFGNDADSVVSYIQQNSSGNTTLGGGNSLNVFSKAGAMTFSTASTERMRIDSSGNVGIGVVPSANSLIQLSNGIASTAGASNKISLYYASAASAFGLGIATGQFTYNSGDGAHVFYTGGNTSPVERMRIDSAGNVGIGTNAPSSSAILDAQSTTKGVRMPNMTTTQKNAISSPAAGLMVFDTTLAKLCVYSGSAWQTITSI